LMSPLEVSSHCPRSLV
jgi:hypothetical protein